MARRWSDYPKRVLEEFDGQKKAIGGAGALITAGAGFFVSGPIGAAIGGVTASTVTFAFCAYKAWPQKLLETNLLIGQVFPLQDLDKMYPLPERVGILGASNAGKTTLLCILASQSAPINQRTDDLYARIAVSQASPPAPYALIDGAGQQYSQQFKIFDEVNLAFVCLDHNQGNLLSDIKPDRTKEHENFLGQLRGHMKRTGKYPKRLHFLLNKSDKWVQGQNVEILREWHKSIIADWSGIPGIAVSGSEHSNFSSADIISLNSIISSSIGK